MKLGYSVLVLLTLAVSVEVQANENTVNQVREPVAFDLLNAGDSNVLSKLAAQASCISLQDGMLEHFRVGFFWCSAYAKVGFVKNTLQLGYRQLEVKSAGNAWVVYSGEIILTTDNEEAKRGVLAQLPLIGYQESLRSESIYVTIVRPKDGHLADATDEQILQRELGVPARRHTFTVQATNP